MTNIFFSRLSLLSKFETINDNFESHQNKHSYNKNNNINNQDNVTNKKENVQNLKSRSLAVEQAYVHDVYSVVAATNPDAISSPVRSNVKNFLFEEFEPGSIVLDVGCGDGKYLNLNPNVIVIGLDYCFEWFASDSNNNEEKLAVVGNGLHLPFLDDYFDGIICCGVLHHLATRERRIKMLRELSRVLRVGGKLVMSVTSSPPGRKTIGSQDVLIKIHTDEMEYRSDYSESDIDSDSYTDTNSSSIATSMDSINNIDLLNDHRPGRSITNSHTANSDLDNCYSFVKRALKRLSLTSGISTIRNPFNTNLGLSSSIDSQSVKYYRRGNRYNYRYHPNDSSPIELHNLDDYDSSCNLSSKSSSTTGDSALSSFNRSSSLSQTSSATANNIFSSSLMSMIKEHFQTWKTQLNSAAIRHSFDTKPSNNEIEAKHFQMFGFEDCSDIEGQQNNHRFSLPISFWKFNKPNETSTVEIINNKNLLSKNKVYASNEENKPKFQNYLEQNGTTSIDVNLKSNTTFIIKANQVYSSNNSLAKSFHRLDVYPHKSLSLEISSSNVIINEKPLIGYCSLPDLRVLRLDNKKYQIDSSKKYNFHELSKEKHLKVENHKNEENLSVSPNPTECYSGTDEEDKDNPTELKEAGAKKFNKKLLRQRSFSADYPPETVKLQPELPRRFSASPNIGTHRYNQNDRIPHQQQISIDSEESFVTIIPAHRNSLEDISAEGEDECDSLNELDEDCYTDSSDDDEACCESISNEENTSNDNSISSVLEATVRTVAAIKSSTSNETCADLGSPFEELNIAEQRHELLVQETTPSPPNSLHRYFHLFHGGELEQLIDNNLANLHILDSYYNDYAMTWSIIAEKINVWTI